MRWAATLMAVLAAGCATRSYEPPTRYTLGPQVEVKAVTPTEKILAVRSLDGARPYRQQIVYRDGLQLGHYANVEWADLPSDAVTRALTDALIATGRFVDVGAAADINRPDYVLTGQLRKFDLRRDTEPWTAECEVRIEAREALGRETLYTETLSASVPLSSNEVSALPTAMSQAVATIVTEAANAIASK